MNNVKTILLFLILLILLIKCTRTTKKTYYSNGQLRTETQYKDTLKDGIYKGYYPNGVLKIESVYKNGQRNGWHKEYYKNGKLEWEAQYKEGKEHGWFREYLENGVLIAEGYYREGIQDSIAKFYYKNGEIEREQEFVNGTMNGLFRSYHKNGQLSMDAIYKNDSVTYYKKFDSEGQLIKEYRHVYIEPESDTICLGDPYHAYIKLGGAVPDTVEVKYIIHCPGGIMQEGDRGKLAWENGESKLKFTPQATGSYQLDVCFITGKSISADLPNIFCGQRFFRVIEKPES